MSSLPMQAAAAVRIGGKGTPRRKVVKKPSTSVVVSVERKLTAATKKLNVQPIPAIEEVNLFLDDGNIVHFTNPQVRASVPCNTFIVSGNAEVKEITELVPGILDQLGPVSISSLKKIADSYRAAPGQVEGEDPVAAGDDEIPSLVESFEVQDE